MSGDNDDIRQLTRLLIQSYCGRNCDNKRTNDLQRLCTIVLNGSGLSEAADVSKIEKDLAVKRGVKIAAEFSKRYGHIKQSNVLSQPGQVVDFLHKVSLNNERVQTFVNGIKQASTPLHAQISSIQTPASLKQSYYGDMTPAQSVTQSLTSGLHDVTSRPPTGRHYQSVSSSGLGTSRSDSRTLTASLLKGSNSTDALQHKTSPTGCKAFTQYRQLVKEEIHDIDLVREVLLVSQGIDGQYAKYDAKSDSYKLPENLRITDSKRKLCYRLFEAGWLYNHIKQYLDTKKNDMTFGPIGQSFCVALQQELSSYHRLLAVLDSQLSLSSEDVSKGLTLLRLNVWYHEPIVNLRQVAALVDVARGKKGGALISAVHSYTWHGSVNHSSLVSHMLGLTVKPLFEMINRWMYYGHLDDAFNEFFVAADPQVRDENLWHFKYSLRKSMIPSFLSPEMARKIMLTGKSVVFIHKVCQDNTELDKREVISKARIHDAKAMFNQSTDDSFRVMLDTTYQEISRHLMEVLHNKYNFINHLKAMRRYLLLGQGDFIQQLMDLLVDELSKDASALYLHNLNGILETAIRATNAQYDDKDILSRLDVRLLEISPGDLGWDVFSLDYRTRGPISTVFTQDTMIYYLRIFNFLWRAKRMEYALANLWREKQLYSKLLRDMSELDELLHSAHVIATEMIHFTQQIGYYINFEVIECSWDELLQKVQAAEDLDHIIAAHQEFLDSIITRCLMDEVHRGVFSQLRTIFDLIIKFQSILNGFFEKAVREKEYRTEYESGKAQRTSDSEWGTTEERDEAEKSRRAEFMQTVVKPSRSQLKVLSQTYQDMVTKFLVMLATQNDYNLQCLLFRLDFNEHYQQKEPNLRSPQVLKKTQSRIHQQVPPLGISQPVGGLVGILGGRVPDQ